jgi:hexosaminidase
VLRTRAAACFAALILSFTPPLTARGGVIPLPAETVPGVGFFNVGPGTVVRVPSGDRDTAAAARYLVELWTRTNRLTLPITLGTTGTGAPSAGTGRPGVDTIEFRRESGFGPEAYEIEVTPQQITVSSTSAAGLFYGAVTLWQLLPPGGDAGGIPAQTIRDAPAYPWRGLMLDSARHFQTPASIRSMIDWMAWHKLNVLHWHLTDDQGWRLEIRKYPRLTSVGAWRIDPNGTRYGGYYTQDEVRGIVRFAAARHVRIVPEIEMPGHATAAIAAYPFLGAAGGEPPRVSADWGIFTRHFNSDDRTFAFLEDVLAEVIDLFPATPIHIGGDEVAGVSGALQASFTQRISRYLAAHGRRIVGWDEILHPGLRQDAIVMSWHGITGARAAAAAGHDTVLAPSPTLYFDRRQSALASEPPGRLDVVSLEDVYRFEPRDATLGDGRRHHVLGVQANLWTEHVSTEARLQWMALPRAAALAEMGWSAAARRRWPDFLERLVPLFARYRAFGLNYADSVFAPAAQVSPSAGGFSLALSNQAQSQAQSGDTPRGGIPYARDGGAALGGIRYTLDGREPSADSPRYEAPLRVPEGAQVRAAAFVESEQASRTWSERFDAHTALRRDTHQLELCSGGIGLLLEAAGASAPLAVDIMNPCWIDRGVDLSMGPSLTAAVAALPFNYQIGADTAKIRTGDARTPEGELEIHVDSCAAPASAWLPLAPATHASEVMVLPAQRLPRFEGRHDLCLRFARPRLDPFWALDWIEIGE